MRTTLELDDRLHEIARMRAFQERRSIGDIISELALLGHDVTLKARPQRRLGAFAGQITIAEDFDDTPPEVLAALEKPIEPTEPIEP